ncbi:hypothetical protein [Epibacterium ulvae]|uniref:hypothetical protein n=1 Tax=Epibacterium ulvae TaxID=1156985 RepID=UPI0024917AE6|nr:hypothetical protein [Epibacterium ulvae]
MIRFKLSPRHPRQGIVLISTLLSLILLIALVGLFQAKSLSNITVLKRLTQQHQEELLKDAVYELIRPFVAEAIVQYDGDHRLSLTGESYEILYDQRRFHVISATSSPPGEQPRSLTLDIQALR